MNDHERRLGKRCFASRPRSTFHRSLSSSICGFTSLFSIQCRRVQQQFGAASMRPRQTTTLARTKRLVTLSIMSKAPIDGNHTRLAELGRRVLSGGTISREEGMWLFDLESTADVFELMAWANRIREHFKGNKVHLCS